jgi:hypothetical protein
MSFPSATASGSIARVVPSPWLNAVERQPGVDNACVSSEASRGRDEGAEA